MGVVIRVAPLVFRITNFYQSSTVNLFSPIEISYTIIPKMSVIPDPEGCDLSRILEISIIPIKIVTCHILIVVVLQTSQPQH